MIEARSELAVVAPRPPSSPSMPGLAAPADVFNDPEAVASLEDGFAPKNIAAAVAMSVFASTLAFATHRALTGRWSLLGGWGVAVSLALLAVASTLTVSTRRPLLARDRVRFWQLLTLQGAAHLTWLYVVCLMVGDFFSLLGLAALLAWVFNDTRYLYDSALLRWQYLAPAAVVDLGLVTLWAARPEVAALLLPARGGLLVFAAVQFGLVVLTQGLIATVGRQNRDRDLRAREVRDLNRQLAVFRKEREVLARAARLMTSGLSSVKFAHDVASPLTALRISLDEAEQLTALDARSDDPDSKAALREMLDIARTSAARILAMSDTHASALRRGDPLAPEDVSALFARAWREAAATLDTHGVAVVGEPSMTLEPAAVYATEGHASTFANLLTNGALQAPQMPLEVRGAPSGPWFYRVTIRDRGVAPEARPDALARIERSLALDGELGEGETSRRYRGYGIALGVARVLLIRHNGWLSVGAPAEGPGVEFCAVLPRVPPGEIPPEANTPEAHAHV
jgi:hypothetical protein